MADSYRLLVHPDLGKDLQQLAEAAKQDPDGPEAQAFAAVKNGLNALRHGREAELDGKQMHSLVDKYGDISDCAEVKVPVVREFAPNGYEFGPSHRLTYREFEGTVDDPTPVREAIAFEPRRGGRPFEVTAARLGRPVGVTLDQINQTQQQAQNQQQVQSQQVQSQQVQDQQVQNQQLQNQQLQNQQSQQGQKSVAPVRRPLPHELAEAARAASTRQSGGNPTAGRPSDTEAGGQTAAARDPLMAQRLAAMAFGQSATRARSTAPAGSTAQPAGRREAVTGRSDIGTGPDASRS